MGLAAQSFAETPNFRYDFVGNATTLIRYSDDHMLRRLANQNLDWWCPVGAGGPVFDDGLDRVAKKLTNNVLQVAQDVGKGCFQMTLDCDVWQYAARAVSLSSQDCRSIPACLHHFTSAATQKDFSYEVRVRIKLGLGVGKVPGRVECFGQGKVLFSDDSTGNPLAARLALHMLHLTTFRNPTDLSSVFMNLSISSGRIRS